MLGEKWHDAETDAKTIGEFMREQNLSIEEYLPSVNGKLVTEDKEICDGMEITFVPVVSGG
ncbi:MAG: MoaD/ThiS family protein [Candidatus Diapherotrites archaeon]|nr:MoaD/ThiS family protein [Candidatus Diapherotrites archaeon]